MSAWGVRHHGLRVAAAALIVGCPLMGCRSPGGSFLSGFNRVHAKPISGYVEYTWRDRRLDQNTKVGGSETKSSEQIAEQNIKFETEGYIYHPNFVEFTLAGLFGLLQQDFEDEFDGRRRQSNDDGTVTEFDLNASFFRRKKYPGSVFLRRHRSLVARPFQSSLETTTTGYGFNWQYINDKTPTTVQFSDMEVLLDPLNSREANGIQKTTEFRIDTAYQFSLRNSLKLTYESRVQTEEPFKLDFTTDEITLSHRLDLGKKGNALLESELNYYDQRGTFDIKRFRWREMLRLKHTERLSSWYRFELIDRTQGALFGVAPITERSWLFTGLIEHQLYDSLVSQFSGFAQNQNYGDGVTVRRYGSQANFDYRKKNRWGKLHASFRDGFRRETWRGGRRELETLDERGVFHDPEPVRLSNPTVQQASLFVTAEDRTTLYIQGRDYTVRLIGDYLELERIPTGRIADGETVLIDYIYHTGGDLILETINHDFSIREDMNNGFSPYYRFRYQDQKLRPELSSGITPDNIIGHIGGLEYRKGPIRLTGEYEDHDSSISPFRALRLSADWTHRFDNGITPSFKARWSDVRHGFPNERTRRFLTLEGRYRHVVNRTLILETSLVYRNQQDSQGRDDEGLDFDLSFEWTLRDTELRLTYEWSQFNDDFTKSEASTLYLQLRRNF